MKPYLIICIIKFYIGLEIIIRASSNFLIKICLQQIFRYFHIHCQIDLVNIWQSRLVNKISIFQIYKEIFSDKCWQNTTKYNETIFECYRYEWKRTISGTYPTVSSFYKGISARESTQSFIDDHQKNARNKKGITYYFRGGNHCSNRNEELYVFSSGRHKHSQTLDTKELCL